MRRWIILMMTGLLVALVLVATTSSSESPLPGRSGLMVPTAPVKVVTEMLDEAQVKATKPAQWAAIARHSKIVVLNSWDYRLIPVLKRANPRVRVWVYKDLSGIRSDDCLTASGNCGSCPPGVTDSAFLSSGMGYCWVVRHHPGWLLHSLWTGRALEFRGYPDTWETNYGNRAYLRQWLRNVTADVHRHG